MNPVIYGRNPLKVDTFARSNNVQGVTTLEELVKYVSIKLIISTVPPDSKLDLDESLFKHSPLVFIANYSEEQDCLATKAKHHNCSIIRGKEMFL